MKSYELKDKVFDCTYKLYINGSVAQLAKAIDKYLDEPLDVDEFYNTKGLTITTPNGGVLLYIKEFDYNNPDSIGTLAHECLHAVQKRLHFSCGVDRREEETPAYYLKYLVVEFLNKIRKSEKVNADETRRNKEMP